MHIGKGNPEIKSDKRKSMVISLKVQKNKVHFRVFLEMYIHLPSLLVILFLYIFRDMPTCTHRLTVLNCPKQKTTKLSIDTTMDIYSILA